MTWSKKAELRGPRGPEGPSAYKTWLNQGNTGTELDFITSLVTGSTVAYSLVWGANNGTPFTLATLRGTPTYGTPARFGTSSFGPAAAIQAANAIATPADGTVFTAELWFNSAQAPTDAKRHVLLSLGALNNLYLSVSPASGFPGAGWPVVTVGTTNIVGTASICDGRWHHLAFQFTRNATAGTTTVSTFWVDGVVVSGSGTYTGAWSSDIIVGGIAASGFENIGSIDEVRVSRGTRYAGAFTPPAQPFTFDQRTTLLAHLDGSGAAFKEGGLGYPQRPATALPGTVTYVGPQQPSDWVQPDRWIQVAL